MIFNFSDYVKGKNPLLKVTSKSIQEVLGLSRDDLIHLAYLLGCDYCEGVRGVGIVNAMEIIENFTFEEMKNILKPWGNLRDDLNNTKFKRLKRHEKFFEKHKNFKKHWLFNDEFGSTKVKQAFLKPVVNEEFKDDLRILGEF